MYALSFSILGKTFVPSCHTRKIEAFEQSSPKRSYQGRNHPLGETVDSLEQLDRSFDQ